jgi:alkylation response protein AidB-like acyl-CoA dehydrogenase
MWRCLRRFPSTTTSLSTICRSLSSASAADAAPCAPADFLHPTFGLTPTGRDIYEAARAFSDAEVAPHAPRWDAEGVFPEAALRAAAAAGFAAMWVREAHGGLGLPRADSLPALEAISEACPSTAAYLSIHGMVCAMIDRHGSEAQRARLLPKLVAMEHFASYALTEPGAGSDAASLTTRAAPLGGGRFALTGQKAFISGGGRSDVYVVMARSGGAGPGGVSAFIVERGAPGLTFGANERKLGWRNQPTAQVFLDGAPGELLGAEGAGFKMAMAALDGGRLSIAACSLGAATHCFGAAREHVKTRRQFGAPLAANQALAFRVADMGATLFGARAAVRGAARWLDEGHPAARALCAQAKAQATEGCLRVIDDALGLHGGYGYLCATNVERYLRDARVHTILEGTSVRGARSTGRAAARTRSLTPFFSPHRPPPLFSPFFIAGYHAGHCEPCAPRRKVVMSRAIPSTAGGFSPAKQKKGTCFYARARSFSA